MTTLAIPLPTRSLLFSLASIHAVSTSYSAARISCVGVAAFCARLQAVKPTTRNRRIIMSRFCISPHYGARQRTVVSRRLHFLNFDEVNWGLDLGRLLERKTKR